jgi:acyl dehydratase
MSERDSAELYRELDGMIGREGPRLQGKVLARDIERYAVASGESAPIYFSESAARGAGYEGIPAPPMMLSSVIEWGCGPAVGELRVDGTGVGRESWLPLDGVRLMGGGQDLVFHAPVLAGVDFYAQPALESVELKEGGAGAMVLMIITTEFRESGGEPLVTCRETLIAR